MRVDWLLGKSKAGGVDRTFVTGPKLGRLSPRNGIFAAEGAKRSIGMKRGVSVAMVGLSVASATACSTIYDLDKYTTGDAASPAATAVPTPTVPFVEAGVESGNDSGAPADEAGP